MVFWGERLKENEEEVAEVGRGMVLFVSLVDNSEAGRGDEASRRGAGAGRSGGRSVKVREDCDVVDVVAVRQGPHRFPDWTQEHRGIHHLAQPAEQAGAVRGAEKMRDRARQVRAGH